MARSLGKIGLGLAGGAAKGLAHIGVLKALEEHDMAPSCIAGTSAGALIGGLYAAGLSVPDMERVVSELDGWELSKLIDLTWVRGNLVAGKAVERFLHRLVGDVRIEDLRLPYVATAVDVNSGQGYLFDSGPLVDAIRASISIPGVFEAVAANGSFLVDGGVRMNLPLSPLARYRPDTLIGVGLTGADWLKTGWTRCAVERDQPPEADPDRNLWERLKARFTPEATANGEEDARGDDPPGLPFLLGQTFNILGAQSERLEVERTKPDLFINLDVQEIELWEFWRGPEAVELGYRQAQPAIAEYLRSRSGFARLRKRIFG